MKTDSEKEAIEKYIEACPFRTKTLLKQMRSTIKKAAPEAKEVISYKMPAFKLNGMLVWYAAFKNHIGFYPRPSGIEMFKKELLAYKLSKGTVQFPLDKPLPLTLITKIVKYRVKENTLKKTN
jgi:uncharacterized protein YdhG (YjbR/CyaY superfamily)